MNISKVSFGIGSGNGKASGLMYEPKLDEQPKKGYHWEHDIDHDKFLAVKNGYKLDGDGNAVSCATKPSAENFAAYAQIQKAQAGLMYEPKLGEQPKKGFHWEHDIDNDRYYAVKDGYKLDESGKAVKC